MRRIIVGALVLAAGSIFVSTAAAASKTVGFNRTDYIYIPERVAVKVGESVTWSNAGSEEPHNVNFEDGKFTQPPVPAMSFPPTSRIFTEGGTFRYYCVNHGRDMSGVVYVNATGTLPPNAQFKVSPNPAVTGQAVTFDAATTKAGDNPVATYEWDLNGDGMYEVQPSASRTTTTTYLAAPPQPLTARLKVTDSTGVTEVRELPVTIDAAPAPPADPTPTSPAPAPQPPAPVPQPQPAPKITTTPAARPAAPSPRTFSFTAASTASRVKGAVVKVTCPGRCKITAKLSVSASVARKARLGRKAVTIGTVRATRSAAGTKTMTVKLTRTARLRLARIKSVRATLKLEVSDASGAIKRKQKSIVLKR